MPVAWKVNNVDLVDANIVRLLYHNSEALLGAIIHRPDAPQIYII